MHPADHAARQHLAGAIAAKVLVALAAVAGVAVVIAWELFALMLWAFRCDENCSAGDYDSRRWTLQLVLAAAGGLAAILSVVLGARGQDLAFRRMLSVAVALAGLWAVWVLGGGF